MSLFLSVVTNKVDAKGRVSVPARFRSALASAGETGFVCYPAFTHAGLEAMTLAKAADYADRLDQDFNPFETEGDAFAQSILAASVELPFDREGRVQMPEELLEHAGIDRLATFVGLGRRFQIWEPDAYEAYAAHARDTARERREAFGTLRSQNDRDWSDRDETAGAASPTGTSGRRRIIARRETAPASGPEGDGT